MGLALCILVLVFADADPLRLRPLHAFRGDVVGDRFGEALHVLPDVDGDGYLDFAVGASCRNSAGPMSGAVHIYSGRNGREVTVIEGEVPFSRFGKTITTGDLDGDGALELVVGAPFHSEEGRDECGRVYVYSITDKKLLKIHEGQHPYEAFGSALYCMDVNADNFEDIVVGAPGFGDASCEARGAVHILSGADGSLLRRIEGEHTGDWFGYSLACIDVDADGHGDPIVSAPGCDSPVGADAGRIYACSGSDGSWLYQIDPLERYDRFALSIGPLDDLTGDGIQEMMATSLGQPPGKTSVYNGATGERLFQLFAEDLDEGQGHPCVSSTDLSGEFVPALIFGHDVGNRNFLSIHSGRDGALIKRLACGRKRSGFGFTITQTLETELTGFPRVALGANPFLNRGDEDEGFVGIFSLGPPEVLNLFKGLFPGGRFGASLEIPGDLDGDGRHDLIVGCPAMPVKAGEKGGRILFYSELGGMPFSMLQGETAGSRLGEVLCSLGDLDGDGSPEFVAGAPGFSLQERKETGRVYFYSSAAGKFIKKRLTGRNAGDALGMALCAMGDITGDKINDFLVGIPGDSRTARNQGKVVLVSGADLEVKGSYRGSVPDRRLGSVLARAGDLDNDGIDDFVTLSSYRPAGAGGGFNRVIAFSSRKKRAIFVLITPEPKIGFGSSILSIPDVDEDGVPDLLVGAPFAAGKKGERQGRVYLYSCAKGKMLGHITGHRPDDQLGARICVMPDLDSDGRGDIAISAKKCIYILGSESNRAIHRLDMRPGWDGFGCALATGPPSRFSLVVGVDHYSDRQVKERGAAVGFGYNLPSYKPKDPALALFYEYGVKDEVPQFLVEIMKTAKAKTTYPLSKNPREIYFFKAALSPMPGEIEWLPLRLTPEWKVAIIERMELQPGRKKMNAWLRATWRMTESMMPSALGFRFKMSYLEKGRLKERVLECLP